MTQAPEAPALSNVAFGVLTAGEACLLGGLTYPSYGHLLTLEPAPRHPELGATTQVLPMAVGAMAGTRYIGLAVAKTPMTAGGTGAELLSLFVEAPYRRRGVGTALVRLVEAETARRGFGDLQAVWMSGPEAAAVERVLAKSDWQTPTPRTLVVRFTPEEAERTPGFGQTPLTGPDFQVFPWPELRPDERAALRKSHDASPWIPPGFEPWLHDCLGFDAVSSVGLRYRSTVVGWVINHRVGPKLVRVTCAFVRSDLSRRGLMPLFAESIRRLGAEGSVQCTFVTPVSHDEVAGVIRRRWTDVVSFVGETRGSIKRFTATCVA